jgi:hypothetical protein
MANLDFYALGDDLRKLIRFLFAETDIVVYESYSEFDQEARRFHSLDELEAVFKLGSYRAGYLQLWSRSVMARPVISRITLTNVSGGTFRFAVEGAGLIQLYLDGIRDGIIYHSHYGHWNEAGARERSTHPADACDWRALAKLSGKIQRHIRGRLAPAKLASRPVLHQAFAAVQQGAGLDYGPNILGADSQDLKPIQVRLSS